MLTAQLINLVRNKSLSKSLLSIIFVTIVFPSQLIAIPKKNCLKHESTFTVSKTLGSASLVKNRFNREGSLRFELSRATARAKEVLDVNFCSGSECNLKTNHSKITLSVIPEKTVNSTKECETYLASTTKNPLTFMRTFSDIREFEDWFRNFSTGKGTDGHKLYELCPGKCSPQYNVDLQWINLGIMARTQIICGYSRDISNNKYQVITSVTGSCINKNAPLPSLSYK
jgi:hypothetical protein